VFLKEFTPGLAREQFGPASVVVTYPSVDDLLPCSPGLPGNLAATMHLDASDEPLARQLLPVLERIAGRLICNGWPPASRSSPAQQHGGPYARHHRPSVHVGRHRRDPPVAGSRCLQNFPARAAASSLT